MMTREITATKQELPLPSPTSKHRCSRFLYSCLARFGTMSLRYWAHAFTVLLGIILLTALLIPVLSYLGFEGSAYPILLFVR